jgi:hypothetical protein
MYNGFDFGKTEIFFRSGLDNAKALAVTDLPVGQIKQPVRQQTVGLGCFAKPIAMFSTSWVSLCSTDPTR